MSNCNNSSSNISGTPIAGTVSQVGSNLEIGPIVQTNHGFTAGNVIRFDVGSNGYTLAQADSPTNAEVCGVVTSTSSASVFRFVVEGDVETSQFILNNTIYGSTGGEVFFLSGETAGVLDSVPPNDAGKVLKSVVVRLPSIPDGSGITQERGLVKNYVGNYLGGDTAIYMSAVNPIGSIHAFVGDTTTIPSGWAVCDGSPISVTTYPNFSTAINKRYGFREVLTFAGNIPAGNIIEQGDIQARLIERSGQKALVEHLIQDVTRIDNVRGSGTGSQDAKLTTTPTIVGFDATKTVNVINGSQVSPNQTITLVTLDSALTPDLRNKFIMGAPADTEEVAGLNQEGGHDKLEMDQIGDVTGTINRGFNENTYEYLTNLPPYVTVNWIIRVGDSSYTSLLNQLSLKTLSLTELPTSASGLAVGSVYNDGGVLKIVT
jgi:microcystin-dependent protein